MNTEVSIRVFATGYCKASESIAIRSGHRKQIKLHANCVLIQHPEKGNILFDTGYAPRFFTATKKWPDKIQRLATPTTTENSWSIVEQLKANGISAADIKHLIISHFHADHICGLIDFPEAAFYSERSAFEQINKLNGFAAVRRGLIKKLLPKDLESRLSFFDSLEKIEREDDFSFHYDFWGDGSIKVIQLPGHARGQIGLILNEESEHPIFLAADGFWLTDSLDQNVLPASITRLIFDNWKAYKRTFNKILEYRAAHPACVFISCHCPKVHAEWVEKVY